MRPCQTCQCFVPLVVERCPRCGAALEAIEEPRDQERDLVLVGSGHHSENGSDAVARSVLARAVLPPMDRPAARPPRPELPKVPKPYAPDPLVQAVFLGIPTNGSTAVDEAVEEEEPELAPDTFAALLGTPHEDLLPAQQAVVSPPRPPPPPAPPIVRPPAQPVATSNLHTEPLAIPKSYRRFTRRDPFKLRRTRRERLLTRVCLLLAVALGAAVLVLRLPLGPRPELGASVVDKGASSSVSIPATQVDDGVLVQTQADLRNTLVAIQQIYPLFKSYAVATPEVLKRSLPQFSFLPDVSVSRLIGEISVAGSADRVVLAEYAGPGQCAFVLIVARQPAETAMGPNGGACRATAAPEIGWNPISTG